MPGTASLIPALAGIAFLIALIASVVFGIIFGYYWFRYGKSHTRALISLSVYALGCVLILLFALSTTNLGS